MKTNTTNTELEVRFLEIDQKELSKKLLALGAKDLGEDFLKEIIFYDKDLTWRPLQKFVRLRSTNKEIIISYKHKPERHSIDVEEIEVTVNDFEKATQLLESIGLVAYRTQEKKRHTFLLGKITVDIDTWPSIPTYVELEGPSEEKIKEAATLLELPWEKAVFAGAGYVIEHYYKIPVMSLRSFTFEKIE